MEGRIKKLNKGRKEYKVDDVHMSKHALTRCQSRGIRHRDIETIFKYADICVPRGNGAELIQISNKKLKIINARNNDGIKVYHLKNTGLILDGNNYVITVMHLKDSRYRRKIKYWKHSLCH